MRWLLCTAVGLAAAGGLIGAARAHHSLVDPPTATVAVVSWVTDGDTIGGRTLDGDYLGPDPPPWTERPRTGRR